MTITTEETHANITSQWELEKKLGLSYWTDSLEIPNPDQTYTNHELACFKDFNFVYITASDNASLSLVFLSENSKFLAIFQILPFILKNYRCYLCNDRLIKERLAYISNRAQFKADNQATRILTTVLEAAINKNASDIHIEIGSAGKFIRIRINGILEKLDLQDEIPTALFSKVKLISKMDISKTRSPQDGHFPYTAEDGRRFDMRVSTVPCIYGEKIVIRCLPASKVTLSLGTLGLNSDDITIIRKCASQLSGLILFTGPTGSGKTTSLYAILHDLISEERNILTIEDPVEYRIEGITQVEVNELAGISFANALRAFLRQDPDVILVGEIRDEETAQIAVRASQTGHLVLSTLHSNDVFETIRRLKNMGISPEDLASSLKLIVSQRLVRKKCKCFDVSDCSVCNGSGIAGRIPVLEKLEVDSLLAQQIAIGDSISSIRSNLLENGFQTLNKLKERMIHENTILPDTLIKNDEDLSM